MRRGAVLPAWLKPSAEVDLRQVLTGIRPALRTELAGAVDAPTLGRWRRGLGLFGLLDEDGFLVLSRRTGRARALLAMDRAPGRREKRFGRGLGYPPCCVNAAARIGEAGLDAWADELAARRRTGRFASLDVQTYAEGLAALSHIPCGPSCAASLKMAKALQMKDAAAWRPQRARAGRTPWTPRLSSPASTKPRP